jgi:asparagine synthetase B (glutamine-hydrolysing)
VADTDVGVDRLSKLQRHRGPDWSGIYACDRAVLAHERLAIVDVTARRAAAAQPRRRTHALAVNGEIYNHRELRASLREPYAFATESDCEVILALYREHGRGLPRRAERHLRLRALRRGAGPLPDRPGPHGHRPALHRPRRAGQPHVASEMKALVPVCRTVEEFPPGHVLDSEVGEPPLLRARRGATTTRSRAGGGPGARPRGAGGRGAPPAHVRRALRRAALRRAGLLDHRGDRGALRRAARRGRRAQRGVVAAAALLRDRPRGARRTWRPRARSRRTSAPCTTSSTSPCRRGSTRSPT